MVYRVRVAMENITCNFIPEQETLKYKVNKQFIA